MRDLRSVWRRQIELVMIIPQRESIIKGYAMNSVKGDSRIVIRNMPYPPNLRRIAARTIDPAMGAST